MPSKFSVEDFVEASKRRFPGRFDYQKCVYVNANTPLTLVCKLHGDFAVRPSVHLRPNGKGGCQACSGNKKHDKFSFADAAKKIHDRAYDYSKVMYVNAKIPIEIVCSKHGSFFQEPSSHLSGAGCPECWRDRQMLHVAASIKDRKAKFIDAAAKKHSDKYSYQAVWYVNNGTPVEILCPEHGSFFQRPGAHIKGQGCPQCGNAQRGEKRRLNTQLFIEKAIEVHGEHYDYSSVDYVTSDDDVIIICPEHGAFSQNPSNHLQGAGCKKCALIASGAEKTAKRSGNLINGFREVHGNRYDYSATKYINSQTKITVICPSHGAFSVTPANHMFGHGCPDCARENRPDYIDKRVRSDSEYANRPGFLYLVSALHVPSKKLIYKIGITSREKPESRFKYSRYVNFKIDILQTLEGRMRHIWEIENEIKQLIRSSTTKIDPFTSDYWHWTESFDDVDLLARVNLVFDSRRLS